MSDGKKNGSVVGVVSYLVLAFGLAWLSWSWLPDAKHTSTLMFSLYALPGAFAPAVATFVVRKWITREGFADAGLGLHLNQWRYYLIGWFLPVAVISTVAVLAALLNIAQPDVTLAHLGARAKIPGVPVAYTPFVVLLTQALAALVAVPLLFGEEFGWRGYLQLRLFPSRPTLAAIATGIFWGLWHWPVIARGYELPGAPVIATAIFTTGAVLVAIIFGWLWEKTGSVWATSLAHAATNAIGGTLTVLWFPDRSHWLFVSYLGVLGWIPLGLICAWIIVGRNNRVACETSLDATIAT